MRGEERARREGKGREERGRTRGRVGKATWTPAWSTPSPTGRESEEGGEARPPQRNKKKNVPTWSTKRKEGGGPLLRDHRGVPAPPRPWPPTTRRHSPPRPPPPPPPVSSHCPAEHFTPLPYLGPLPPPLTPPLATDDAATVEAGTPSTAGTANRRSSGLSAPASPSLPPPPPSRSAGVGQPRGSRCVTDAAPTAAVTRCHRRRRRRRRWWWVCADRGPSGSPPA